jgi:predicted alpha/beta hydrolase family esterase
VERVLLVSPPSRAVAAGIPEIAAFAALTPSRPATPAQIAASDNDPYCPEGAEVAFGAPLGLPVTVIPKGGHIEPGSGYGEWPSVLAWCLDPATELVPRPA